MKFCRRAPRRAIPKDGIRPPAQSSSLALPHTRARAHARDSQAAKPDKDDQKVALHVYHEIEKMFRTSTKSYVIGGAFQNLKVEYPGGQKEEFEAMKEMEKAELHKQEAKAKAEAEVKQWREEEEKSRKKKEELLKKIEKKVEKIRAEAEAEAMRAEHPSEP